MASRKNISTFQRKYPFRRMEGDTESDRWKWAEQDCRIFKKWERGEISGINARRALTFKNDWTMIPDADEFKRMANNLGYYRENDIPEERKFGIYGETD